MALARQLTLLWALALTALVISEAKPMFGKPPKDIVCKSNRVYAAVGDLSTAKPDWLSIDVQATSIEQCIKACYEYRYCYSISYDEKQKVPCNFYLHLSTTCKKRPLRAIGEIKYEDKPIFVECLRCVNDGEENSTPLGIDYLKKTDDSGTKIMFNNDQGYDQIDGSKLSEDYPDLMDKVAFKSFKECDGDLMFRQSGQAITNDQIKSMSNSTLAGSAKGCARACYSAQGCQNAIYIPNSGLCVFNTKQSSTICTNKNEELKDLSVDEPIKVECIRCSGQSKYGPKEAGKSNDEPMSSSVLVGNNVHYARSCTVVFQVWNQLDGLNFQPDQEASVTSLNECAFICYQNSCSGAIYEPPSSPGGEAKCRVAIRQKENCGANLQNHYSFNTNKNVALSCFRCVQNRPVTLSPDAEIITSTVSSLSPPEAAGTGSVDKAQTDTQSSIQLVHTKQGCAIMFQADKLEQRPNTFTSTFETELAVETADLCAMRCYQNGCTGALFVAEQRLCKLGYGDRHSCSYGSLVSHFIPQNSADQIWIHCVSCQQDSERGKIVSIEKLNPSTAEPSQQTTIRSIGRDESRTTPESLVETTEQQKIGIVSEGVYETTEQQLTTVSAQEQSEKPFETTQKPIVIVESSTLLELKTTLGAEQETTVEGGSTSEPETTKSTVTPEGQSQIQQTGNTESEILSTTNQPSEATKLVVVEEGKPVEDTTLLPESSTPVHEEVVTNKVVGVVDSQHDEESSTVIPVQSTQESQQTTINVIENSTQQENQESTIENLATTQRAPLLEGETQQPELTTILPLQSTQENQESSTSNEGLVTKPVVILENQQGSTTILPLQSTQQQNQESTIIEENQQSTVIENETTQRAPLLKDETQQPEISTAVPLEPTQESTVVENLSTKPVVILANQEGSTTILPLQSTQESIVIENGSTQENQQSTIIQSEAETTQRAPLLEGETQQPEISTVVPIQSSTQQENIQSTQESTQESTINEELVTKPVVILANQEGSTTILPLQSTQENIQQNTQESTINEELVTKPVVILENQEGSTTILPLQSTQENIQQNTQESTINEELVTKPVVILENQEGSTTILPLQSTQENIQQSTQESSTQRAPLLEGETQQSELITVVPIESSETSIIPESEISTQRPQTATVPADHLLPEELTTILSEQSSTSAPEQKSTSISEFSAEEDENVTSPLPPAQTSIIIGQPIEQTTEKAIIPEAESIQSSTNEPEIETTSEEGLTGTTEELKQAKTVVIFGSPLATTLESEIVTANPLETTVLPITNQQQETGETSVTKLAGNLTAQGNQDGWTTVENADTQGVTQQAIIIEGGSSTIAPSTVSVELLASEGTLPTTGQPKEETNELPEATSIITSNPVVLQEQSAGQEQSSTQSILTTKSPEEEKLIEAVTELNRAVSEVRQAITKIQNANESTTPIPEESTVEVQETTETVTRIVALDSDSSIQPSLPPLEDTTILSVTDQESLETQSTTVSSSTQPSIVETTIEPLIVKELLTTQSSLSESTIEGGSTSQPEVTKMIGIVEAQKDQMTSQPEIVASTGESLTMTVESGSTSQPELTKIVGIVETQKDQTTSQPIVESTIEDNLATTILPVTSQESVQSTLGSLENIESTNKPVIFDLEHSTVLPIAESTVEESSQSEVTKVIGIVDAQKDQTTSQPIVESTGESLATTEGGSTSQPEVTKVIGIVEAQKDQTTSQPEIVASTSEEGLFTTISLEGTTILPVSSQESLTTNVNEDIGSTSKPVIIDLEHSTILPIAESTSQPEIITGESTNEESLATKIVESATIIPVTSQDVLQSTSNAVENTGSTTQSSVTNKAFIIDLEHSTVLPIQEGSTTGQPEKSTKTVGVVEIGSTTSQPEISTEENIATTQIQEGSTEQPEVTKIVGVAELQQDSTSQPEITTEENLATTISSIQESAGQSEVTKVIGVVELGSTTSQPELATEGNIATTQIQEGSTTGKPEESTKIVGVVDLQQASSTSQSELSTEESLATTALPIQGPTTEQTEVTKIVGVAELQQGSTSQPELSTEASTNQENIATTILPVQEGSTVQSEPTVTNVVGVVELGSTSNQPEESLATTVSSIQESTTGQSEEVTKIVGVVDLQKDSTSNQPEEILATTVSSIQESTTGKNEEITKIVGVIELGSSTSQPEENLSTTPIQEGSTGQTEKEVTKIVGVADLQQGSTSQPEIPTEASTNEEGLITTQIPVEQSTNEPKLAEVIVQSTTQQSEQSASTGIPPLINEASTGLPPLILESTVLPQSESTILNPTGIPPLVLDSTTESSLKQSTIETEMLVSEGTMPTTVEEELLTTILPAEKLETSTVQEVTGTQAILIGEQKEGGTTQVSNQPESAIESTSIIPETITQIVNVEGSSTPLRLESTTESTSESVPVVLVKDEKGSTVVPLLETTLNEVTSEEHLLTGSTSQQLETTLAPQVEQSTTVQSEEHVTKLIVPLESENQQNVSVIPIDESSILTTKSPEEEKLIEAVTELNRAVSEVRQAITKIQNANESTTPIPEESTGQSLVLNVEGQETTENPAITKIVALEAGSSIQPSLPPSEDTTILPVTVQSDETSTVLEIETSTLQSEETVKNVGLVEARPDQSSTKSPLEASTNIVNLLTTLQDSTQENIRESSTSSENLSTKPVVILENQQGSTTILPLQSTQENIQQNTQESTIVENLSTKHVVILENQEGSTTILPLQSTQESEISTIIPIESTQQNQESSTSNEGLSTKPVIVLENQQEGVTTILPLQSTQENIEESSTSSENLPTKPVVVLENQQSEASTNIVNLLTTIVPIESSTQQNQESTIIGNEGLSTKPVVVLENQQEGITTIAPIESITQENQESTVIESSTQQENQESTINENETTQRAPLLEGETQQPEASTNIANLLTTLQESTQESSTSNEELVTKPVVILENQQPELTTILPLQSTQESVQSTQESSTSNEELVTKPVVILENQEGSTTILPLQSTQENIQQNTQESSTSNEELVTKPVVILENQEGSTTILPLQSTQESSTSNENLSTKQIVILENQQLTTDQTTQQPSTSETNIESSTLQNEVSESQGTTIIKSLESTTPPLEILDGGFVTQAQNNEPVKTTIGEISSTSNAEQTAVTEPSGELLASKSETNAEETTIIPIQPSTTQLLGLEITKNGTLTEDLFPAGATGEASAESIQTTIGPITSTKEVEISEETEEESLATTPGLILEGGATTEIVLEVGKLSTVPVELSTLTQKVEEISTPQDNETVIVPVIITSSTQKPIQTTLAEILESSSSIPAEQLVTQQSLDQQKLETTEQESTKEDSLLSTIQGQLTTQLPVLTTLTEILATSNEPLNEESTTEQPIAIIVPENQQSTTQSAPTTLLAEIITGSTEESLVTHQVLNEEPSGQTQQSTVQPVIVFSKATQSVDESETSLPVQSTTIGIDEAVTSQEDKTTTVPEIVRAVSELVGAIGRNTNTSATTPEPPVLAVSEIVQTLSKHGNLGGMLTENQGGFGGKGCEGDLYFSGAELTDYDQPFEMILASDTVRECARSCFDLGCTSAAFTRFPRPACLMHFKEHEPLLTQKCYADNHLNSTWRFTRNEEVVQLLCIKCGEKMQNDAAVLDDDLESSTAIEIESQHEGPVQGYSEKCNGRVEFQIAAVATFPKLNVTNDVQADSPADCARKCMENKGCTTAGYVPITSSSTGSGVCLLTSDTASCLDDIPYHPQHASTVPFVISCIKCSKCKYTLSVASPDTQLVHKYDNVLNVNSVNECAEKCAAVKCVKAEFDPTNLTCSLTSESSLKPAKCPNEKALETNSIIPVILDCVQCAA